MNKILLTVLLFSFLLISCVKAGEAANLYVAATSVRIRSTPSTSGAIVTTLPLGTWAKILEKSTDKQTLVGKSDHWYKIEVSGKQGWIFGGLTALANEEDRFSAALTLIKNRLEMQDKPIEDQVQLHDFAASVKELASHSADKARLELAHLKTVENVCQRLALDGKGFDTSHSVITANKDMVFLHESAGQHFVAAQAYWQLAEKYSDIPVEADEIAWAAANQPLQGETEGDPVAVLSFFEHSIIAYMNKFPAGRFVENALKSSTEAFGHIKSAITDDYFADETYASKKDFIESVKKVEAIAMKTPDSAAKKEFLNSISKLFRHLGN